MEMKINEVLEKNIYSKRICNERGRKGGEGRRGGVKYQITNNEVEFQNRILTY